jgi:hypothetical protein
MNVSPRSHSNSSWASGVVTMWLKSASVVWRTRAQESKAARWAGHLLDELLQERFDHVRRGLGLEAGVAPLDEHVRDQGEGERMAVGEVEDGSVLFGRNLSLGEVLLTLLLIEIAQGQRAYEGLPTRGHASSPRADCGSPKRRAPSPEVGAGIPRSSTY